MGWRETIKAQSEGGIALVGSFRGARFIVPSSDAAFGRRVEVHEYARRDKPWVEDLGRKARPFNLEVFVDGTLGDYLTVRDNLIAAIETEGPGTLVHPFYGTMTVSLVTPANVRENTSQGGRATFRLEFIESGELRYPSSGSDTAVAVSTGADGALISCSDDFVKNFDIDGLPGWSIAELAEDLYATLAELEDMVGGVAAQIAAEIRAPGNMAAAIIGSVQRLQNIATEPLRALAMYRRLFGAGDDCRCVGVSTPIRQQQAVSTASIHRMVQQCAVIEACRSASRADFPTRDDALGIAAILQDVLDEKMMAVDPVSGQPISDAVYQSLATLRAIVAVDLRTRGARLPNLSTYTPPSTMPALVVAHNIYGDATRAEEIVSRNRIGHPGFVPGGTALEILSI